MEFKFLSRKRREALREGESDQESDYRNYRKVPRKISRPKDVQDKDGFYLPVPDPFNHTGTGLSCRVLGASPERVIADMTVQLDRISRELYETEMRKLTWQVRCEEINTFKNLADLDRAADYRNQSDAVRTGAQKRISRMSRKDRKTLLDSVTWKYDWIQFYKKDCYLFADYVIRWFYKVMDPEKLLVDLSEDERKKVMDACSHKKSGKLDVRLRTIAEAYEACIQQNIQEEAFCTKFMVWADRLPESNRCLVDTMYEIAWNTILLYRYGLPEVSVPDPLYTEFEEDDLDWAYEEELNTDVLDEETTDGELQGEESQEELLDEELMFEGMFDCDGDAEFCEDTEDCLEDICDDETLYECEEEETEELLDLQDEEFGAAVEGKDGETV